MFRQYVKKITLILVIVITVAACTGGNNEPVTPTPTSNNTQEVILIWWNLWEPEENVRPLIDAYEAAHPNVTIQYDQKGVDEGIDDYKEVLDTVLTDNDPLSTPDIFTIHNTWAGKYEQFINKDPGSFSTEDLNDFYPVVRQDFSDNGLLAIPLYMDALAIIYNKDKLIAGGYTTPSDDWSEFQNQAKNLTNKGNNGRIVSAGFSAANADNTEFLFEIMNLLFIQNGVQMLDQSGQAAIFGTAPEVDEAEEARGFYNQFSQTWSSDFKIDIASFLEKKLAMYAAPSWRLIDILNYNEKFNLNLDVGVVPMPQLGGDENIYWASYWGQTVSKDSSNAQVAWDFLKFITEAQQLELLDTTVKQNGRPIGILYPRTSMAEKILSDEFLGAYAESLPRATSWDMVDGYTLQKEFINDYTQSFSIKTFESRANTIIQGKNDPP